VPAALLARATPYVLRNSFRQLGNIGGDAPCLVAGEQLDYGTGPGSRRQKKTCPKVNFFRDILLCSRSF
jgi:hypothetical protein